jgi:hypothetical protein
MRPFAAPMAMSPGGRYRAYDPSASSVTAPLPRSTTPTLLEASEPFHIMTNAWRLPGSTSG